MLFEEEWPQSIGISEFVTGWEVVRLPSPLAFGSQVGTLSSERVSPSQGERVSILIFYRELYKARRARGWGGICFDEPAWEGSQWFIYILLCQFSYWQFWSQWFILNFFIVNSDVNDSFIFHSENFLIGNSDVKRTVLFNSQRVSRWQNPPEGGVGYQKSATLLLDNILLSVSTIYL